MQKIFHISILTVLIFISVSAQTKTTVLAKGTKSWDGNTLKAYPAGQPEISILRIKIPAGAELPVHNHPIINAGVLISGELTVVTEKQDTLHLKAGEGIIEVVDKWHFGKNEGKEEADIIVFYAGIKDKAITVKKDDVKK